MNRDTYEQEMRALDVRYEEIVDEESTRFARAMRASEWGHHIDRRAATEEYNSRMHGLDAARLSAERALERAYYNSLSGAMA